MSFTGLPFELAPMFSSSRSRSVVASALAAIAVLGGYAGSRILGATAPSQAPGAGAVAPAPLSSRLIAPSASFVATGRPTFIRGASAWTSFERSPSRREEIRRLGTSGFVAGATQRLRGQSAAGTMVTSTVEQFRTATAARRELGHRYSQLDSTPGARFSSLSVGIPGARGVSVTRGGDTRVSVMFVEGSYYYAVSAIVSSAVSGQMWRRLASATGLLYESINACVCVTTGQAPNSARSNGVS